MDHLSRVLLNVAYYLIPAVMIYHLWGWVYGVEVFTTVGGRGGFLVVTGLAYLLFTLLSELHQPENKSLRADLLDFIQGNG